MLEELSLPFRLLFVITVFLLSLRSAVVAETNLEVKKLVSFLDLSPFPVSFCGNLRFSSSSADIFSLRSFFRDLEVKLSSSVSKL